MKNTCTDRFENISASAVTLTAVTKACGCENLSMEDCTLKKPLEGGSVEKYPLCGCNEIENKFYHIYHFPSRVALNRPVLLCFFFANPLS